MTGINGIQPVRHIEIPEISGLQQPNQPSGEFKSILQGAISQVESSSGAADQAVQRFLSGEGEDLHTVALATQRAELQFELFQQVRNKVVQAYQEVMRTQL